MSLPGSNAKTQQEQLDNELATQRKVVTERLQLPGIETLHEKSKDEIASVLTNLLKSKAGMISLKFVIGEAIEIEYDANPYDQLRG